MMACEDREAETLKLAEFEAMGKAMSEELAVYLQRHLVCSRRLAAEQVAVGGLTVLVCCRDARRRKKSWKACEKHCNKR